MTKSLSILSLALLAIWAAPCRALAPADWKAYFGLDTAQQKRFAAAEKERAAKAKPLRDQEKSLTENLKQQVESKAPDAQIGQTFGQIRGGKKGIQAADEAFLDAIAGFLTPTQQAKWILKNHKPKSGPGSEPAAPKPPQSPKPPEDPAKKAADKAAAEAWKQSFALTPDQKAKFDAANKAKGETMKGLQAAKESALEQLGAKVEAKAPDAEVKPAVDAARRALAAIPAQEDSYWDTLGGFLTPTQQAKLYLKNK